MLDRLRHPVGAKDNDSVVGHFIELFDKDRTAVTQIIDHKPVVNDFMADINGFAKDLQRAIDNIDRPIDTGTKTTGIGE